MVYQGGRNMAALDKHDTYKEEIKDLSIAELKSKKRKKLAFPWKEKGNR